MIMLSIIYTTIGVLSLIYATRVHAIGVMLTMINNKLQQIRINRIEIARDMQSEYNTVLNTVLNVSIPWYKRNIFVPAVYLILAIGSAITTAFASRPLVTFIEIVMSLSTAIIIEQYMTSNRAYQLTSLLYCALSIALIEHHIAKGNQFLAMCKDLTLTDQQIIDYLRTDRMLDYATDDELINEWKTHVAMITTMTEQRIDHARIIANKLTKTFKQQYQHVVK